MELSLITITDKNTGKKKYHAVNESHYNSMLASGGCWEFEKNYEWEWLGDLIIDDDILEEEGWRFNESIMG